MPQDYGFVFFDFFTEKDPISGRTELHVTATGNNSLGVDSSYLVSTFVTDGNLFINQPSKPLSGGSSYNPIFS